MKTKNGSVDSRAPRAHPWESEGEPQFQPQSRRVRLAGLCILNGFVAIAVPTALTIALRARLMVSVAGADGLFVNTTLILRRSC